MTIGSQSARPDSGRAGFSQKLLSLLVALMLALSMVPGVAWADATEGAGPSAAQVEPAEDAPAEKAAVPKEPAASKTELEAPAGKDETIQPSGKADSKAMGDGSEGGGLSNAIEPDAAGASSASAPAKTTYELSSVDVASSGQLLQAGNTAIPHPKRLVQGYESDVPSDADVTYAWYVADDAAGANARAVGGFDAATGELALTDDLQGMYAYVEANAGSNTVRSEPFLVECSAVRTLTVGAKVVGTTKHEAGGEYRAEAWVPLTEYAWSSDARTTAWDVFAKLLDKAGYCYDLAGGTPYSITTPDKTYTLAMSESAPWCYWAFFVNGEYASVAANGYVLQDGDAIELRYIDAASIEKPSGDVAANPGADHPDLEVGWGGFANGGAGSVVQDTATPTGKADAAWTSSLLTDEERAAGAYASASEPLIVGGKLFVVSCSTSYDPETWASVSSLARIDVIDPSTGTVEKRQALATSMDSVCRPVYADGIIVIPLSGGCLQAVSAATLETLWVVEGVPGAQSLSTLTVSDGYVYVSTADSLNDSWNASSGTIRRINLHTGALAGSASNDESGYYWAGGVMANGCFLVPDDSGKITSYAADLSTMIGSVQVGDKGIRSSLVVEGGFVYAASSDGVLHKLSVGGDGALAEVGEAPFAAHSTSTPTIAGGKAYVGGSLSNYKGVLAVIDLDTMTATQVTKADGTELPAAIQGTPLVSMQGGRTYVYFTYNGATASRSAYASGGGVYVYRAGDAQASLLYDPTDDLANYCMASVIAGPDGTLYYTNDSGHLFALRAKTDGGPDGGPNDGNGSGGGGNGDAGNKGGVDSSSGAGGAGFVPAAYKPLPQAEAKAGDARDGSAQGEAARASAATATSAGAGTARAASESVEDGAASGGLVGGVNPWAVGGVAVGIVGLAGTAAYAIRVRRRGGEAS